MARLARVRVDPHPGQVGARDCLIMMTGRMLGHTGRRSHERLTTGKHGAGRGEWRVLQACWVFCAKKF